MEKKVLITGVDGFIGKYLKDHFKNQGFQVFGTTYFNPPEDDREIQFDITKDGSISELWDNENFEIIIHTIGLVDQTKPYDLMYAINALGTKYICEYAISRACKHLIFTSSASVYGLKVMGENNPEQKKKRKNYLFLTPYGKSKAIAEQFIEESGLNYTNLRLPIVLGRNDTFITPSIVPRLLDNTMFRCGWKKRKISVLYVKNLGPLIESLINVGPLNQSVNCLSDSIFWDDFVQEFALNLGVEYHPKIKSKLSIFTNAKSRDYQFIAAYSAFGAHYLGTVLSTVLSNWKAPYDWKDGVKDAIENYLR